MWAQWVCSRERRTALYKRSSVCTNLEKWHVKEYIIFFNLMFLILSWRIVICAVDSAVAQAQEACMTNMGQCCVAGTRTFVHEKIYDQFVKKSAELASARKVGDPFSTDTINGPQVRSAQKLQRQVPVMRNSTEDTMIYRYIIIMDT